MGFPAAGTHYGDWKEAVRSLADEGFTAFEASWHGGVPTLSAARGEDVAVLAFHRTGSLRVASRFRIGVPEGEMAVAIDSLGTCWECGRGRYGLKDGCLQRLPGTLNACCGHGTGIPYAVLESGTRLTGWDATGWFRSQGLDVPDPATPSSLYVRTGGTEVLTWSGHPFVG